MKTTAWGRGIVIALCGVAAFFLLLAFSPPAEAASCDGAPAPCAEDVAIDGCTQCHSITIPGGNRNGTDRKITLSTGSARHILSPAMSDWTGTVNAMISKGSPANAAKTAGYLNSNYCPTCTGPILSSASVSGVTASAATVGWTTSANGFGDQPATSCVIYGTSTTSMTGDTCNLTDPAYDPNSSNLVTTHSVTLSGLTSLTKYYVVHRSTAGSQTATYYLASSFTTPPSGGGGGGGGGALGTIISLATGDYNNDFKIDLGVGVSTKNHVIAYLSDGSGGFTQGQTLANVGTTPIAVTSGGVKGDFNQDGKDDLAVANFGDKNVAVFLGASPSGFQTAAVSTVTVTDPPTSVATGDFNSDGILDLAVATVKTDGSEGAVLIFTGVNDGAGHGTGQFAGPLTTIPIVTSTVLSPTITSVTPNVVYCPGLPTDITITGTLLLEGLSVTLDGTFPLTVKSVSADSTSLVATVPATATAGVHSLTVEVGGLPPVSAPFTIDPRVLTVTSVVPSYRLYEVNASGSVSVYGSNFNPGGSIYIGSVGGPTVEGTSATATTPYVRSSAFLAKIWLGSTALAAGTYDVDFTNNDSCGGVGLLAGGFIMAAPQPTITSVVLNPVTYGISASQSITISGTNFVTGARITVGSLSGTTVPGSIATAASPFVFVSSHEVNFYWEQTGLAPGVYSVEVTNPAVAGGLSAAVVGGFTVSPPQPTVTSVSASTVTYGVSSSQQVTIYGSNFLSGATITVGGVTGATVAGSSATATTPFVYVNSGQLKFYWNNTALLPGAYNVQVSNPAVAGGLMGTLEAGFTVTGAQPIVTSMSPTAVTYGITGSSSIAVYGTTFVAGATITVGSISGPTVVGTTASATTPFVWVSNSQLKFYWPNTSLVPGVYAVQVTNPADSGGLSSTLAAAFTVTAPQPTISNLSPAQVTYGITGNSDITIFGSQFIVGATITVGSLSGVTVAGSSATATTPFVYVSNSQLKFYWTNTSLAPNAYGVQVTNPTVAGTLSATLDAGFTVAAPQPSVTSVSPVSVSYGVTSNTSVTVYGSNFIAGATITVGSLSGATVTGSTASATTPFVYVSNSQLKFYWPNTSLPVGAYSVTVVNPPTAGGLSGSLVDGFTVAAPQPTVSSIVPTLVTYGISANQGITIYGSNFVLGATITVGSLSGATVAGSTASTTTPFVFVSTGQLKFYWPNTSLPVGAYTVTVVNPLPAGGLAGSLASGFTVAAPPPTISSVYPTPVTYGVSTSQSVTITGSSFIVGGTITVGSLSGTTVLGSTASATTPFVFV
ncbi:MAG: VCBS repeat-containing protein, partial [Nitrospirae bacterium]|nr:VCBS repeat-containing protein [Nitrospirota bacterium]